MSSRRPPWIPILVAAALLACDDGHRRGSVSPSEDGRTYLAILDDNGGKCGPITVDGEIWARPIGEPGHL